MLDIFVQKVFLLHALNLICNTGIPTKFLLMIGQKKEKCLQLHVLITQRYLKSHPVWVTLYYIYIIKHDILIHISRPNGWTKWTEIFWGHSWLAEGCHRLKKIEHFIFKQKKSNFFQICFQRAIPGPSASQHIIYNFTQNVFLLLCPLGRIFPVFS